MNLEKLKEQLILHEDKRLIPYRCSAGKWTIGVGRNLDDKGLTKEEVIHLFKSIPITDEIATYLLNNDISDSLNDCRKLFSNFNLIPEDKQLVLADMMFNMGYTRLRKFRRFCKAIKKQDWENAAKEMKDSLWYNQVGSRAQRLYKMMIGLKDNYTGYYKD